MKMTKLRVLFLSALMLAAASLAQSAEQEPADSQVQPAPSAQEESTDTGAQSALSAPKPWLWRFHVNVYSWLPHAPATIKIEEVEVSLPEKLKNIIKALEMMALFELEVHKGPIGIFAAPSFYKGKYGKRFTAIEGERRKFDLKETVFWMHYGISYDFGPWPLSNNPNSYANVVFQPYAGFLFLNDNIKINVSPGEIAPAISKRSTIRFNTPIIGLNTIWNVARRWNIRVGGDVGGYNVDGVQSTYRVYGTVAYRFKTWDVSSKVFVGYKYLFIDYDKKDLSLKVSIKGPLIGVGVEF
jgi:hypothetical protein